MPNEIANALGTQRQFTPQPRSYYQGRYNGINAVSGSRSDTSRADSLASSMAQLNTALQSYLVSHEKYLDEMGAMKAQEYINPKTPEELKTLNVSDGAIQMGIISAEEQPYFYAHTDKLRGNLLAKQFKTEYDRDFAMSPAKTMEAEQSRYQTYVNTKLNDVLDNEDAVPANLGAFNLGFYEAQPATIAGLADTWTKKKYADDVQLTMAQVQSDLGDIIKNAPTLLQTNGAMSDAVQEAMNNVRLAGLPLDARIKLLNDFSSQLIQTGNLDATRFTQMMDRIDVLGGLDGSSVKASSLLNMALYQKYADDYNKQFLDVKTNNLINDYIKREDFNGWLNMVAELRKTNPAEAERMNQFTPQVRSGVENVKYE